MKNAENEKYVKLGVTGAAIAAVGLVCYFLLSGLKDISGIMAMASAILAPFIYGVVIACLLAPLCTHLERKLPALFNGRWKRLASSLSIFISLLLGITIVLAVLLLVIPQVIQSVAGLVDALPGQIQTAWDRTQRWLENRPELAEQWTKIVRDIEDRVNTWLKTDLTGAATALLTGALGGVYDTVSILKNLLIGLIVSVYLLARRRQLAAQAKLLGRSVFSPSAAEWIEAELRYAGRMFNAFFLGRLLDSAIVGLLCFAGCLIMGFESPALISVIVGVTNILPVFGPFIGAIPCALLLLLKSPMQCFVFLIFILILQQLDGNVIGPRILGNTTGMSGLWVIFAILLFGGLWGVGGMIAGVPLMAVIYDIARQLAYRGIRRKGREDLIDSYNAEFHPMASEKERTCQHQ